MDDLVQWLRAQLDEDERMARAAGGEAWQWEHGYGDMCNDRTCPYGELATDEAVIMQVHGFDVRQDDRQVADHIAAHDPARVLSEIDAKRRLVDLHTKDEYYDGCVICDNGNNSCGCMSGWHWTYPCDTLKILALPYADRPGYREEWRP
ncbi:DUF6221 family protein [Streptomyces griseoincarnatus]